MINIYSEADLTAAKKQKNRILIVFYITLAILLSINIAILVIYTRQEFNTKYKMPLLMTNILSCSVYAVVMYFVFSIKYKRVNAYTHLLINIRDGLKAEDVNAFVRVDSAITEKDGVDFASIVVLQWSEKKQEYFERHILCDLEKPLPEIEKGDVIRHITHGNVLVAYELNSQDIFE